MHIVSTGSPLRQDEKCADRSLFVAARSELAGGTRVLFRTTASRLATRP